MRRELAPRWLSAIVVRLGASEYDAPGENAQRWMWRDGDYGLRVDARSHTWTVFAWSPLRSVSLRLAKEPTSADLAGAASLAGVGGPSTTPPVKFDPGVASVPLQEAA